MAFLRVLSVLYFVGYLVICSRAVFLSQEKVKCIPRSECSHIDNLAKINGTCYQTKLLMNLVFCYIVDNSEEYTREDYIKCISPSKVDSFMRKANLLPHYGSCGLEKLQMKIDGGETANLDEYPWIALLKYRNYEGKEGYGCHGNLINRRYVLTAAHCVDPQVTFYKNGGNISSVVLGEYDTRTQPDCLQFLPGHFDCTENITELQIESYHIHPNYNDTGYFRNDIALIRMKADVEFSDFIHPVCLPPLRLETPFNDILWIGGWGTNSRYAMNPVKVKAKFRIKLNSECQVTPELTNRQFCASSVDSAKTCPGDSGGPLMMRRKMGDSFRFLLIGIDSLGTCGLSRPISIYTQVSPYIEWIVDTIHK